MPEEKIISSQKSLFPVIEQLDQLTQQSPINNEQIWLLLEKEVLVHRVKFPVLEFLATQLYKRLVYQATDQLMELMASARHISCYPVIGKMLQLRLDSDFDSTYAKAIDHIIRGNEWYACDIISERVFGEGTLLNFEQSMHYLKQMGEHENFWVQRSIGIAAHYATKKKLSKDRVEQLLLLMITHAHKTQYFTKKGIGWAGKTIAKHHPDLISKHEAHLKSVKLSRWFITKLNTGLSMAGAAPFVYE